MALKIKEISTAIAVHLARFEADPVTNRREDYWLTGAGVNGRWVAVTYIEYQGYSSLTKAQAAKYLAWLDAGNVGKHWDAL